MAHESGRNDREPPSRAIGDGPPAHLVSAAKTLQAILTSMYPEFSWVVRVRNADDADGGLWSVRRYPPPVHHDDAAPDDA